MKKYEFKTLEIETNEGFLTGLKTSKLPDLPSLLNAHGKEGWMVVQRLAPEIAQAA